MHTHYVIYTHNSLEVLKVSVIFFSLIFGIYTTLLCMGFNNSTLIEHVMFCQWFPLMHVSENELHNCCIQRIAIG